MRQKELVLEAIQAANERAADEAFDAIQYIEEEMTPDQAKMMDELPFMQEIEARARGLGLTEQDIPSMEDLDEKIAAVSDLMTDDPYIPVRHEEGETNILDRVTGLTDDDMQTLDET